MRTTTDGATVGRSFDLTSMADSITRTILDARLGLPREGNGRPKAPSNPRAAQIRKEMAAGRSAEIARIATVLYTDLEDGVAFPVATAGIRRMLTFLQLHAEAIHRRQPRPLTSAFAVETKAQYHADVTAHRVIGPNCTVEQIHEAIGANTKHIAALEEFNRSLEAELAARHDTRTFTLDRLQARA